MESKLVDALGMSTSPIAVILSDAAPEGALQFKEGRWGCVASTMIAVAKGRTAVFDRKTFGCPGGGVGLGFGDQYTECGLDIKALLSTGDPEDAARSRHMAAGERFFKSPELVQGWLDLVPMTDVPTEFVVLKPFEIVAGDETPELVVFLVDADQLAALAVMSDYARGSGESTVLQFGAACQSIVYGYAEALRDHPRGVVGFLDISRRKQVGRETLSFTAPWLLFCEMESNVPGSFLEMEDWHQLRER
jgi:uncharacterized protein (DUF169 family)